MYDLSNLIKLFKCVCAISELEFKALLVYCLCDLFISIFNAADLNNIENDTRISMTQTVTNRIKICSL
jgi:hypothetical protein